MLPSTDEQCAPSRTSQKPVDDPMEQPQNPMHNASTTPLRADLPPYSAYLGLVSFTATITISVSISSSQGFATGGSLFGVALDGTIMNATTTAAIGKTIASAKWLAWSAATSTMSLVITLILQLMLTDDNFVRRLASREGPWWRSMPRVVVGVGSWIALGLQGTSLGLIGEALKTVNAQSGAMIQWCLLGIGMPAFLFYIFTLLVWKDSAKSTAPSLESIAASS